MMFFLAFILPLAYAQPPCPVQTPVECAATEMMCLAPASGTGCPGAPTCFPQFDATAKDSNGNPCPAHCPTVCGTNEIKCDQPKVLGCDGGKFCMAPPSPNCPAHCPVHCEPPLMLCPGAPATDGCPALPGVCLTECPA